MFPSRQPETVPASRLRGRCAVRLLSGAERPEDYLREEVRTGARARVTQSLMLMLRLSQFGIDQVYLSLACRCSLTLFTHLVGFPGLNSHRKGLMGLRNPETKDTPALLGQTYAYNKLTLPVMNWICVPTLEMTKLQSMLLVVCLQMYMSDIFV